MMFIIKRKNDGNDIRIFISKTYNDDIMFLPEDIEIYLVAEDFKSRKVLLAFKENNKWEENMF